MPAVDRYKRKLPVDPLSVPSKSSATFLTCACYRCGSTKHLANDSRCPAVSVNCNNCQKLGHFSRVCHSQQTCSVHEVELPELQILYMHDSEFNKIKCTATIMTASASVPVELIVDSGSSVSILPKAVSNELQRLLDLGVIERVDAFQWISPIVVVQKKSAGIRMCVDLRETNKAVVADSYTLPHIDELMSMLHGATVFSTIDLENAYFQLLLHEESHDLTAFITSVGHVTLKK